MFLLLARLLLTVLVAVPLSCVVQPLHHWTTQTTFLCSSCCVSSLTCVMCGVWLQNSLYYIIGLQVHVVGVVSPSVGSRVQCLAIATTALCKVGTHCD